MPPAPLTPELDQPPSHGHYDHEQQHQHDQDQRHSPTGHGGSFRSRASSGQGGSFSSRGASFSSRGASFSSTATGMTLGSRIGAAIFARSGSMRSAPLAADPNPLGQPYDDTSIYDGPVVSQTSDCGPVPARYSQQIGVEDQPYDDSNIYDAPQTNALGGLPAQPSDHDSVRLSNFGQRSKSSLAQSISPTPSRSAPPPPPQSRPSLSPSSARDRDAEEFEHMFQVRVGASDACAVRNPFP
jgi:hypothetical protein